MSRPPVRQPTLTPEKSEKILAALKAGNYRIAAATYAGVQPKTFNGWILKGNRGQAPYAAFAAACKEAEGHAESALVATIRQAAKEHWTAAAWLLERKFAARWGKRDVSYERTKREERAAAKLSLAEIPLEDLRAMVTAEEARRAMEFAAVATH